ncbi:hypothetical protein [Paracoccus haematequi]|uniref:hypothetical protein n=1 Tax=Paracoccus haematequi TaxID=2491866 RepID=UPI0013DF07D1|nr:hypothetical protein [Paracoccus haematequi]
MRSNLIDLEARLIRETEKARCFDFGLDANVWLPKSQHEWDAGGNVVTLPEPVAVEKGIV